ncbi:MAG: cell surface protein SprA, partial [Bacteroidales bacterium]|nr:cell surface protein SprA [Bacteroidales bacterium]
GVSYIDDFEGTKSTIDLRSYNTWYLGSTPQFQDDLFPEANFYGVQNSILYGFNRAKIAWYIIDPSVFYDRTSNIKPENVTNDELSNHFVRQVQEAEVFPGKEIPNGTPTNIGVFNVAFYPEDKGPYNYDAMPTGISAGVNEDGTLADPESRWGGIMRKIETPDFEAANIEYIEFWMLDPFADDTPNEDLNGGVTGGDLYFNLGDVSEDILKDSRKSYEHGLPISDEFLETEVINTVWGRIPNKLDLVQSFANEAGSREYQDVGYDGLRDETERVYFTGQSEYDSAYHYLDTLRYLYGENSVAYNLAVGDPSGDNYRNYRGGEIDTDLEYASILKKYKEFNGPDGNSPEAQGDGGVYAGNSRQPNAEDLNDDNTLSEGERYFQYKIELKPEKMKVGQNYITDVLSTTDPPIKLANGESAVVKWYQFKIPVRDPSKIVGNITDFKSIRFMRMFMKEFQEPIVLRFATLDLVRGEWRRYPASEDLLEPNVYLTSSDINSKVFDLSAVNTDENRDRVPIPYVKPPGIEDEINIGTTNLTRMNEQSMVINVCNLANGDAVGAYKTTEFDFRQFKYLKMFVHAESAEDTNNVGVGSDWPKYGDLTIFMRLGSDFTQNYYEYEIPLKFTDWGATSPSEIWPENNEFNIDLERLADFKLKRNTAMREPGSDVQLFQPYVAYDGKNKVTVFGSPSISDVEAIMIGVRNPMNSPEEDEQKKCAEIWVNELRLTDFNKQGGWATTGRISMNLADLGNLAFSGLYSSPWFASIDTKITDIQLDAVTQFDIATNLELGKFFPQKAGVRIPMHFDYGENRIIPEYNPLDPDLLLDEVIDSYDLKAQQDSLKSLTVDYTQRKNLNFMNVRKDKVGAQTKSRIYDIENFDLSYSYSENYHRNVDIERDMLQNYMGGLGYNFNTNPKNVKPFEKIGFIANTKALQIIKDFNFYFMPKMFSFRTDMTRMYNERKLRNKSFGDVITLPTYNKTWDWNRMYDLKFDLAQSLTFNFNANVQTYIDEYHGSNKIIDRDDETITPEVKKQQVKDEILRGGTKRNYAQNAGINWNVPINKIPLFNWITSNFGYNVAYNWTASPKSIQDALGNTISNNKNWNINGNADLNKLYNKVGFLKKINEPKRKRPSKKPTRQQPKDQDDSTKVVKPKVNYAKIAYETVFKLLMSVKKVTIQYSENTGTSLPGFMPVAGVLGNNWSTNAPGMEFIFGYQPESPDYFNQEGWLSNDERLNTAFTQFGNNTLNVRFTLEPFKDLKIDITADRTFSENAQSYYTWNPEDEIFNETNRMEMGSYSTSYITWGTAFGGSLSNERSQYFENMKDYRIDIANRLAQQDPRDIKVSDSTGYPEGYGPTSQYVLLPS